MNNKRKNLSVWKTPEVELTLLSGDVIMASDENSLFVDEFDEDEVCPVPAAGIGKQRRPGTRAHLAA